MQNKCWVCGSDILIDDNFCRTCGVELTRLGTNSRQNPRVTNTDGRVSVGIFLATVGGVIGTLSYLMGIIPMLALGVASVLIGIMVLYLPESNTVRDKLATDSSLPSLLNIEKLLEDLELDERGVYIPTSGLDVSPKVFVPLVQTPATKRPPLRLTQSNRIFVTVGKNPEDRGILLDAPGSQILAALEQAIHLDLTNTHLDSLRSDLDSGFRALGIAKVTSLEYQDASVRIVMDLSALINLETKLRNLAPRLVSQVGTPIASAIAAAVSKATGRYVTVGSEVLDLTKRELSINLRLNEYGNGTIAV